jgi:hypothetical protein
LAETIQELAGLPPDEAERVASQTVEKWRERHAASRSEHLAPPLLFALFALGAVALLPLVALAVWLIATKVA